MTHHDVKTPWEGWHVITKIGRGGFGSVYEIERLQYGIQERAAMKVITIPQSADEIDDLLIEGYDNSSITQRFDAFAEDIVREYGMMAQMKGNANIVYCDDYKIIQQDNGFGRDIYIRMELLTPLLKALDRVSTESQIIRFGMEMCNALEACQKRKVIHRDIKPQNIFVSDDGVFKLGDFGIARKAEKTTHATVGKGTYQFMAPEVKNELPYGPTVDVYSLGLVMYWLLNNRRCPFFPLPPAVPTHKDEQEALRRRFSGEQIPAPKNGSEQLKRIVLKACAFDPKDRYQSAWEMREDLACLSSDHVAEFIPGPKPNPILDVQDDTDDNKTVGPIFTYTPEADTDGLYKTAGPVFDHSVTDDLDKGNAIDHNAKGKKQKGNERYRSASDMLSDLNALNQPAAFIQEFDNNATVGAATVQHTARVSDKKVAVTPQQSVPAETGPEDATVGANMTRGQNPNVFSPVNARGRHLLVITGAFAAALLLFVYFFVHIPTNATCTGESTCKICSKVLGSALGHEWSAATCTDERICDICGLKEGAPLGHEWVAATCTEDQFCSRCGITNAAALGHEWVAATCSNAKTCSRCNITEGSALTHIWLDATYSSPKTCTTCGLRNGLSLGTPLVNCTVLEHSNSGEGTDIITGTLFSLSDVKYNNAVQFWVSNAGHYIPFEHSVYSIAAGYDTLCGTIALGKDSQPGASVQFLFYSNGSLIYSTKVISGYETDTFRFDISSVTSLRVECVTDSECNSYGILQATLHIS